MLTVIVITKNEEQRIEACLESAKWADEIIVFDNGSTDDTLKIAKKYTDKIYESKSSDFSEIRNKAMEKATNDWVLYVDADERILKDLKDEIIELITTDKYSAYAISRCNIIFGSEQKYGPFYPDWVIRLIKKSSFEGWIGKVHEYAKFSGELGYTKNSLLHLTHRGVDQIIAKTMEWSKIDAKLRLDSNHPKMTGLRFLRIFVTETFNQGVVRKGFFSGTTAVMDSLLQIFSMVVTYIRLWEMQQPKKLEDQYDVIDKRLKENDFKY